MWGDKKSIPQSNSYFFDIIITFYHRKYILFTQITIVGMVRQMLSWEHVWVRAFLEGWNFHLPQKLIGNFFMRFIEIFQISSNTFFCQKVNMNPLNVDSKMAEDSYGCDVDDFWKWRQGKLSWSSSDFNTFQQKCISMYVRKKGWKENRKTEISQAASLKHERE